jgi:hypothetical protein
MTRTPVSGWVVREVYMFGRKRKTFVPAANLKPLHTVRLERRANVDQPAANVSLIKANGVDFEKRVTVSLQKQKEHGVGGLRWDVVALLDESGSMGHLFRDGTVQRVTEAALAWTAGVDADGMAPVGAFGSHHIWHGEVNLTNVMGVVDREGWNAWGSTNLTSSLDALLELAPQVTNPMYAFIVTDGSPDNKQTAIDRIAQLSQYPVFVKILLVGNDPWGKNFVEYLDDLEDHEPGRRLFDNVDAQHIADPRKVNDHVFFANAMTEETASAIEGMKAAGLATE